MTKPVKPTKCGLKHKHNYYDCCAACIHGEHPMEGASGHVKTCKYFREVKPTEKKCKCHCHHQVGGYCMGHNEPHPFSCEHCKPPKKIAPDIEGANMITRITPCKHKSLITCWDCEAVIDLKTLLSKERESWSKGRKILVKTLSDDKKEAVREAKRELVGQIKERLPKQKKAIQIQYPEMKPYIDGYNVALLEVIKLLEDFEKI